MADFAKEVAALQEENKHLKQLLHNQVSGDSSDPGTSHARHAAAGNCAQREQRHSKKLHFFVSPSPNHHAEGRQLRVAVRSKRLVEQRAMREQWGILSELAGPGGTGCSIPLRMCGG